MQEIKTHALELVNQYAEQLASKGIKLILSKRYVETAVHERYGGYGLHAIFNSIDRANDRRKETEKGYNYTRNKYHSMVITVLPLDQTLVKPVECREYAFVLKKAERAHLGLEPQKKSYREARILSKMEKRILKILKQADKKSPRQLCKNTFWDACRYAHSPKYEYKPRFCGKDRFTWDMIFMLLAVATVAIVFLIAWAITKFI